MPKKILIAIAALAVVLVITAIALVTFVDVNRFKPRIEQFVADRYHRKLQINGDLALSVFPRFAVTLPSMTLSDPILASTPPATTVGTMASLAGARVSVALVPLLRGEIIADRVTVDGLEARIVREADGRLNIDDLLGKAPATGPAASSSKPPAAPGSDGASPAGGTGGAQDAPATSLPRLDVGGLTLTRSRIQFDDRQAGNTATIGDLALETGRIRSAGTTPITLTMNLGTTKPKAALVVRLKGDADYDLDAGRYGARALTATVSGQYDTTTLDGANVTVASLAAIPAKGTIDLAGLDLTARGRLVAGGFDLTARAPRVQVNEDAASGDTVTAALRLDGPQVIEAKLEASGPRGKATALSVERLAIDATATEGPRKVVVQLATPVNGDSAAGSWQLPALAGKLVVTDPAVPNGTATLAFDGTVGADTKRETVATKLSATGEGTALKIDAGIAGFSAPKIRFDVQADQLDVDRFLPPKAADAAPAKPTPAPAPGGAAPASADAPIDLTALRDLTVDGRIAVARLKARGIAASEVSAVIKAAGGRVDIAPVAAQLYQGRLGASATIQAGATPPANRFATTVDLAQVAIGPLLQAVADTDLLEGRGNVKLTATTGGATVSAMKAALDGNGSIALVDGSIKGINLAETIRSARNLLQGGGKAETRPSDQNQKTDFTSLTASFVITDGVATSRDLDLKSPLIRVGGEGSANLVTDQLDYTVRASVVATSSGQGGKELSDLNGLTVPVRLTGALAAPTWQIDWVTAGRELLKSRAGAELKERLKVDELEDKAKDKARERVGDALKGLLGR